MIALRWHVLRLPLLLSLLWCLLLFALFQWTVQREDENATELAQIQTRTLFSSIVNTRGWNADRGGVWATEQPNCQPNPWLPEDQRTLLTADGRRLVRFNPAYMTRQIAERFQSKTMNFHICGCPPNARKTAPTNGKRVPCSTSMRERPSGFSLFRDGGVRITVIWHRCGRRKAACNAIRETKSGTCSAASAYPFPPFPSLPRLNNATIWLG